MSSADAKKRMEKALENLHGEFRKIRSGKANPTMLDSVKAEAYGQLMPLNQLASVSALDGTTLMVKPFDPSTLGDIDKSIQKADLGLNPSNDGSVIRIKIPELSTERREELKKNAKAKAEDARIAVRNIRRDENDSIKKQLKDKEISEDEEKSMLDDIQKLTDGYIKKIDESLSNKEKELSEI